MLFAARPAHNHTRTQTMLSKKGNVLQSVCDSVYAKTSARAFNESDYPLAHAEFSATVSQMVSALFMGLIDGGPLSDMSRRTVFTLSMRLGDLFDVRELAGNLKSYFFSLLELGTAVRNLRFLLQESLSYKGEDDKASPLLQSFLDALVDGDRRGALRTTVREALLKGVNRPAARATVEREILPAVLRVADSSSKIEWQTGGAVAFRRIAILCAVTGVDAEGQFNFSKLHEAARGFEGIARMTAVQKK